MVVGVVSKETNLRSSNPLNVEAIGSFSAVKDMIYWIFKTDYSAVVWKLDGRQSTVEAVYGAMLEQS